MASAASQSRTDAGAQLDALTERAAQLDRAAEAVGADVAYSELFQAAAGAGALGTLLYALRRQSVLRRRRRLFEEAEELAELGREIAQRCGERRELGWLSNALAATRLEQTDLDGARAFFEQALDLGRELDDQHLVANASQNLGIIDTLRGEASSARALYLESIASAVRSADAATPMYAYNNLGLLCRDEDEWLQARLFFELGLEAAERAGDVSLEVSLRVNLAEVLIHMGEIEAARDAIERMTALAIRLGNHRSLADAARHRALIARLEGDLATAERHGLEAVRQAESAGLALETAEGLEALGAIRRAQGRLPLAISAYRQARDTFESIAARAYARRAARALAAVEAEASR